MIFFTKIPNVFFFGGGGGLRGEGGGQGGGLEYRSFNIKSKSKKN